MLYFILSYANDILRCFDSAQHDSKDKNVDLHCHSEATPKNLKKDGIAVLFLLLYYFLNISFNSIFDCLCIIKGFAAKQAVELDFRLCS